MLRQALTVLAAASLILCIAGRAAPGASSMDTVTMRLGISYGDRDSVFNRLDLYLPPSSGTPRPGVLLVHGGGWWGGNRGQWKELARLLAGRGFVCASTSYRLAPGNRFPAAISDVRTAMDYFKRHAAEYGLDPDRVGAVGSSAGGHLVTLLATIEPGDRLGDQGNEIHTDTRPRAVACYNPVLDFLSEPRVWPSQLVVFGAPPEAGSSAYREESPALRISGKEPSFLFLYGTLDNLTPEPKSRLMVERLAAFGVPVEVAFFQGMEHGFGYRLKLPEQVHAAETVADFFTRKLR